MLDCGSVQQVYENMYNAALPQKYDGPTSLHNKPPQIKTISNECCLYHTIKMIVKAPLVCSGSGRADYLN